MASSRITVLISGSGTNLQALIDACASSTIRDSTIVRVISDRKDAYGLQRAQGVNIPTSHHGILRYKKLHPDTSSSPTFAEARKAYDADLAALVLADKPDLIVCAGFMRILTPSFLDPVSAAKVPIINLHPSLHGDLVGAGCIEDAWEEFEQGKRKKTGVMIHYVVREVDLGEPVVQREVGMEGCKDIEELKGRIHEVEHKLIVEGARKVLEGRAGARQIIVALTRAIDVATSQSAGDTLQARLSNHQT
ncbi:Bifunctional purine biosynthetic protein ADE5,7 [Oleoguttula sp. CCFEE 5521]